MTELAVLQALRLKGRVAPGDLAATTGEDAVSDTVASLSARGLLKGEATLRLTPEGRDRLAELLATERADADTPAIRAAYAKFRDVNAEFKALVTDWQLKDGAPNPHDDAGYDAAVLARLDGVHEGALDVVNVVAAQLPRLRHYGEKLCSALDKVRSGDTAWLTRPIIDSYHTVWFELHEELIIAAGLTREEEAAAGHA
jgi:hypothetical protein